MTTFHGRLAGAFRFNIWRFGQWVETTVDDHLPVLDDKLMYCNALGEPPEFWGALLEKAYAKSVLFIRIHCNFSGFFLCFTNHFLKH